MKRYICMEPTEFGWATRKEAQAWIDDPHNKAKRYRVVELNEVDQEACAKAEQERRDEIEKAYIEGGAMARRLLRLQLGLAVPEDRL